MASGNRASMREGPLAQLFRKTEDDAAGRENRKPAQEPKAGRPLPRTVPPRRRRATCRSPRRIRNSIAPVRARPGPPRPTSRGSRTKCGRVPPPA